MGNAAVLYNTMWLRTSDDCW